MQHTDSRATIPIEPASFSELRNLTRRAKAGDATALPRMREILKEHPEVYQHAGDLERIVVRQWAELLGGDDPLTMESLRLQAEELRAELEGESPTPLEKLLVGQVVAHWLEMGHAQLRTGDAKGSSLVQASFDLKRAESAQRRYLAAMKTLTTVRQLMPRGLVPATMASNRLKVFDPDQKTA